MRRFTLLLGILLTALTVQADGIEFFHGTWQEALDEAKAQDKLIFVDAYAVWCGPCKRMAKNVFPVKEVGDFYNANFIPVKLDMEKGDGLAFRRKYGVSSYPTLFYIDGSGEVVLKAVGGRQAAQLIEMGQSALARVDKSKDMAVEYEQGRREPQFVLNYVQALNKANKSSLKVANDYLRTQEDLTTEFNLRFLYHAVSEADSRIFDLFGKHYKAIAKLYPQEELDAKVASAATKTLAKAIEYRSEDLLLTAQKKYKKRHSDKTAVKRFKLKSNMQYGLATRDADLYQKNATKYAKSAVWDDAARLNKMAEAAVAAFEGNSDILALATGWAERSVALADNYVNNHTLAALQYAAGDMVAAKATAEKAMTLAKQERVRPSATQILLQQIKA